MSALEQLKTKLGESLSVEGFKQFADSKPADEAYSYMSVGSCALAQYAESVGRQLDDSLRVSSVSCGGVSFRTKEFNPKDGLHPRVLNDNYPVIELLDFFAMDAMKMANSKMRTFGALSQTIAKHIEAQTNG